MAQQIVNKPHSLVLPARLKAQLDEHLFPGDRDEHGAVVLAGVAETAHEVRLLAREVRLAKDGYDYVPGKRGYRMLRAEFITHQVLHARDEHLVYLAVHNHGGIDEVAFSHDDMRSHERGYPTLLQIVGGMSVGALVFAKNAVAGDIWRPDRSRVPLARTIVVGPSRQVLTPGLGGRDPGQTRATTVKYGSSAIGAAHSLQGEGRDHWAWRCRLIARGESWSTGGWTVRDH